MVFSSKSGSKSKSKSKKGSDSSDSAASSGFGLHSPLRRSKHKHQQQQQAAAQSSAPIPIAGPSSSSSSAFLELPGRHYGGGATSSASTTPSQFSDSHSPSPFRAGGEPAFLGGTSASNYSGRAPAAKNGHGHAQPVKAKSEYRVVGSSIEFPHPLTPSQPPSSLHHRFANGQPPAITSDSPLPSPWAEEALITHMAFDFSPHQLQTLKEAFNFFDIDRDGRITSSELHSVFKFLGSPVTADQVELMISDADIDGNGTVELNEFLRMMKRYYHKHEAPTTEEEEMLEAFKAFDHNGDSFIDFDEIKKTMHFLGELVSDEEVRAMIREADADKDGRINFEEFKKMMSLMRMGPVTAGGSAGASCASK